MKNIMFTAVLMLSIFTVINAQSSIIIGDSLSNAIIYNNIKDTTTQNVGTPGTTTYNILDLENDGTPDIEFSISMISSPSFYSITKSIKALSNLEFAMYSPTSSVYWMQLFAFNSTLDTSGIWLSGAIKRTLYSAITSISGGGHSGLFNGSDDYLGFRKITPSDTIYGWLRLGMQPSITIKSYAYQNKYTGLTEKTITKKNIIYFPNPCSNFIIGSFTLNPNKNTLIEISNQLGQVIFSKSTNRNQIIIDLAEFSVGIYYIKTINGSDIDVREIILQK
jgi:hypothetical protein